jgi:hypothetical protein
MPAMVFARSTGWLQTTLFLTLGLLLAAFLHPWAPKWRPGSEKDASRKNIKKQLQQGTEIELKKSQIQRKSRPNPDHFGIILVHFVVNGPRDPNFVDLGLSFLLFAAFSVDFS